MPEAGRFMGEDIISGRSTIPKTFNRYGYCWLNPIRYIDLNGKDPITPQQARDMAWEFWEDQVQKVVSEIENEIDSIQNDINETIDAGIQMAKDAAEAVGNGIQTGLNVASDIIDSGIQTAISTAEAVGNGIQTGVNAAVDFGKDTWNTAIDLMISLGKSELELMTKLTGANTINLSASGRAAMGVSVSGAIGFTVDSTGNIAFQGNVSAGGGIPSVGAGLSLMLSDTLSYENLEGWGAIIGGSWGEGVSAGYDLIFMDGEVGHTFSIGSAINLPFTGFLELHGETGYTITFVSWNPFSILENLKFKNINKCPNI
jgi:membrane-associated protease RseP (regulator of RpoE activity)